ncbi:MAG: winged helix-turn-helix domain-containing protein [Anaerolinea sp.]|nr:winged helix-turn-helix domain-containing protein [Anaerolinea sp.]
MNTAQYRIGRLRKKVEDDPTQPTMIATVWGAGYRFEDGMA